MILFSCFAFLMALPMQTADLPIYRPATPHSSDWLVHPMKTPAKAFRSANRKEIILSNGIVSRTFRIEPNAATVGLYHHGSETEFVRAVSPEAVIELNGTRYTIGGLSGQPNRAYLKAEWLEQMKAEPEAFRYVGCEVVPVQERMAWKRTRPANETPWPPKGIGLKLNFAASVPALQGVSVAVHYELYEGLPAFGKWIEVKNETAKPMRLNRFLMEKLAVVEAESIVDRTDRWDYPNLTAMTDYSFGGMSVVNATKTVYWTDDPDYSTQVNYELKTPCVLEIRPPLGPDIEIAAGQSFSSFRSFLLLHDSTEKERKGLTVRKFYRALAPWTTENPLMMHLTTTEPQKVREAIDQCAAVGFEMVILSFGSSLNMEDDAPANIAKFKALADYAHSKGIQLGGYSLLASRRIDDENDVINPKTGKTGGAIFGNSPCLGSKWGLEYFAKLRHFLDATGFDLLEHDGSYPGDVCASTTHPGHKGLEDSQWKQYQQIAELYRWCRGKGIYLNVPDWYFLAGSNKTAMGYRETNWSLPRAQQHLHARLHLYDGTWEKTPSMGWMFVPLSEYHGGGAEATIEPLKDHLPDYQQHLMNCLGYGAQACYRGPRLFDTPETQAVVANSVTWFKKYRTILESDVIHLRRPDARDWDGILHVNPNLPIKGMAVLYNPTNANITREIRLPLRYTGLTTTAQIQIMEQGKPRRYELDKESAATVRVTLSAQGTVWLTIR